MLEGLPETLHWVGGMAYLPGETLGWGSGTSKPRTSKQGKKTNREYRSEASKMFGKNWGTLGFEDLGFDDLGFADSGLDDFSHCKVWHAGQGGCGLFNGSGHAADLEAKGQFLGFEDSEVRGFRIRGFGSSRIRDSKNCR